MTAGVGYNHIRKPQHREFTENLCIFSVLTYRNNFIDVINLIQITCPIKLYDLIAIVELMINSYLEIIMMFHSS